MEEYCKNCGAVIRDGAKFCQDCGSEVEITKETIIENRNFCENCGSELTPGASFCAECGHSKTSALTAPAKPKDNNRTIIIGLVAVVAIL
ncbi:MAG: zinc ribbon domain-containing protein, partial [Methanobrevibacter sp.]